MREYLRYRPFRLNPVNITFIYLILGFIWIVFSDRILENMIADPVAMTRYQTLKGWFYVSITGILLYVLVSRYSAFLTRMNREYTETFDQYKALLKHANQIIIQVDGHGRFRYINPIVTDILGYKMGDLANMDGLESIVHEDDRIRFGEINRNWEGPPADTIKQQLRLRLANGSWRWFMLIASDERRLKHVESWLLIIRDIHDETILYEQLKQALQQIRKLNASLEQKVRNRTRELEATNRDLEAFAYSISHDLRAPLRGIDGFSLTLLEKYGDQLDHKGKDYLSRIRAATRKMGFLIDDILSLSRIATASLQKEPVDITAMSRDIFQSLREKEPEKAAGMNIPDDVKVTGDPGLLRVVMQNLIDNAWKFSSQRDAIRIDIDRERNGDETRITIRDNGVGFNMKYYNKLFTMFQRLHSEREFPGTGIGLATVQRIINRHSGRIWAESEEGKGSVFYMVLPDHTETSEEES